MSNEDITGEYEEDIALESEDQEDQEFTAYDASLIVALDDGHGMETAGKRTPIFQDGSGLISETGNFMYENEFNRAVVSKTAVHLERCGIKIVFTAPGDGDTPLKERCANANNAGADIFISVHANANMGVWGNTRGIETLYHPSSVEAKALATALQDQLLKHTQLVDRGLQPRTDLYVLNGTRMPAALVECGFMDNLNEAKLLLSDAYRGECAEEIARGACDYLGVAFVEKPVALPPVPPKKTVYEINVSVNGKVLSIPGVMRDGNAYVPLRAVAEAAGGSCGWDTKCNHGIVNSQIIKESFIMEESGFGWSREVATALGLQFQWDGNSNVINLFA